MYLLCNLLLLSLVASTEAWFYGRDEPDRWSNGGVFPLPFQIAYRKENRTLDPLKIGIELGDQKDCDILRFNAENYVNKWFFPFPVSPKAAAEDYIITIKVKGDCPITTPEHGFNEAYKLRVTQKDATISSDSVWGAVRALETFSHLIFYDDSTDRYLLRTADINDAPRFPVRGVMIDSSRHFLSVKVIKRQIDLMAHNKMNLLHWHLVDSEAFPYNSTTFPQLSAVGAYSRRHIYSQNDVQEVINYARLRAIRVMPEFDLPGHANSWRGQAGLLTKCYDDEGKETYPNLFDPSEEANFKFVDKFLAEIVQVFPDEFLHLGGDEVIDFVKECWDRNEKIQSFMKKRHFNDTIALENYFFDRLIAIVDNLSIKKKPVFWQEVFDNNKPDKNAVIHIWKGNTYEDIMNKARNTTAAGFPTIISACWYLNYIKYGADWRDLIKNDWPSNSRYYYCDPAGFEGTEEQKKLILGGIVAIWGEFVDNTNIEARLWPRASAAAERLWSPAEKTKKAEDAWPRMHELRCKQVARGYRVQSTNFPDYCPFEYEEK